MEVMGREWVMVIWGVLSVMLMCFFYGFLFVVDFLNCLFFVVYMFGDLFLDNGNVNVVFLD